jgi:hypothetical protein
MKFEKPNCPLCGGVAIGTCDTIAGTAVLSEPDVDGNQEHVGETDVCWDTQTTNTNEKGELQLICYEAHTWYSAEQDDELSSGVPLPDVSDFAKPTEYKTSPFADALRNGAVLDELPQVQTNSKYEADVQACVDRAMEGMSNINSPKPLPKSWPFANEQERAEAQALVDSKPE